MPLEPASGPTLGSPPEVESLQERAPVWLYSELPARYAQISAEIDALRQEARRIEEMGSLLWQTGMPLIHAVRNAFASIGFATELAERPANYDVAVHLDRGRRLLVQVAALSDVVDRTSPKIVQILQTLQFDATEQDKVVFIVNAHYNRPFQDRPDPVTFDALKLIAGLGAILMTTSTLFAASTYALRDPADARKIVNNLHGFVGGQYK